MNKLFFFNFYLKNSISKSTEFITFRNSSSALFVTNDLANKTTSILAPFINLRESLRDPATLRENLKVRKISVDVESLILKWSTLCEMCKLREKLENQKTFVHSNLQKSRESGSDVENSKWMIHHNLIKSDLKFMAQMIVNLEKITILEGLKLPNYIHPNTPSSEEVVFHESHHDLKRSTKVNHESVGKNLRLLEILNPVNYYLLNDAVQFEHALTDYFVSYLTSMHNFIPFSNADFCKSVVIEGVGWKLKEPYSIFRLADFQENSNEDERMFLVGGASLEPFCAYHCKNSIHESALPLKYITQGRNYSPNLSCQFGGLYNVVQSNTVEVFIATSDDSEKMMLEFKSVLEAIISLYEKLDLAFRCSYTPASELNLWECLRISFQIYSPYHDQFIEVGNLSISDDFISKRLRMHYHEKRKDPKFLKIISGSIVRVPPFLACLLEGNENEFQIPHELLKHKY